MSILHRIFNNAPSASSAMARRPASAPATPTPTLTSHPTRSPGPGETAERFSVGSKIPVPDVMNFPPHFSCGLSREYVKRHGSLLAATAGEFVAARNREYRELEAKLMQHHATDVVAEWHAAMERGELVGSLEDFKLARQMRSRAIKRELAGIMAELLPLQHEIAAKLGAFAAKLADEFQERESAHLADFGMAYEPSRLVTLLRYTAKNPGRLISVSSGLSPEKALAWAGVQFTSK